MGTDGDDLSSVVVFRLCGQLFAVTVDAVREVVPYAWLATPPRMPAFVQGVLNLGGLAVPVLRLDMLLGMPPAAIGLSASILIMKSTGTPMGLLVEHVEGVRPRAGFQFAAVDEAHSFQGCVAGQLESPQGAMQLVSWERVLLVEEERRLAQFQQDAQDRLADLADAGA
ncbi:MAG: chemotaxis protein CheW [Magnetospirillum sp.]|nr:chemotaxis protein CheW [Magnetospirillum sp.]